MASETKEYPKKIKLSDKTTAYVGFKDDRVEIGLKIPIYGEHRVRIEASEFHLIEQVMAEARSWAAKNDFEKEMKGAE